MCLTGGKHFMGTLCHCFSLFIRFFGYSSFYRIMVHLRCVEQRRFLMYSYWLFTFLSGFLLRRFALCCWSPAVGVPCLYRCLNRHSCVVIEPVSECGALCVLRYVGPHVYTVKCSYEFTYVAIN